MTTSEKRYKVAGHVFGIVMDRDSALWERMEEPYGPFLCYCDGNGDGDCDGDDGADAIFSLTLNEGCVLPDGMSLVYSNRDDVEPGFIALSVYKGDAGHFFEFTQPGSESINGSLFMTPDLRRAELSLAGDWMRQWLTFNTAVNFCYLLSTAQLQTVLAHASCVLYEGRAYLFLGKSGTGKSTHSRMWQEALEGVVLMNDDHPVLRIGGDGKVMAYGSPWSGKTRCYKNIQAPVGGIVRISRAPHNRARRLSMIESYASLMTSFSGMTWEKDLADGRDRTIQGIISTVPCWVMECLPDNDAAEVCSKAVTEVWR